MQNPALNWIRVTDTEFYLEPGSARAVAVQLDLPEAWAARRDVVTAMMRRCGAACDGWQRLQT